MAEAELKLATVATTAAPKPLAVRSRARTYLRMLLHFRKHGLGLLGAAGVFLVVVLAVFAPLLSPYDPNAQDLANVLQQPSRAHLLGTDDLGRDVMSRLVYGSRVSLEAGVVTVFFAVVVGLALGLLGGYAGGWIDEALMRLMDAILAFPPLVLALAISAALGQGLANAMVAIAIVSMPHFSRLARGQVLSVKQFEFVTAARACGGSTRRLVLVHVLPNITSPIVVHCVLSIAAAIIVEASLSFLGVGVQPPTPSWGGMLRMGYGYVDTAPWLSVAPGVALFITVLAFNFFGDAVQDVLDPRRR
jgi:peptide/nickel transport system permease protein